MEVYSITSSKYAGVLRASGKEGRWNRMGEDVIYCASSRSLAALELLVHLSGVDIDNKLFSFTVLNIPQELLFDTIEPKLLSESWKTKLGYNYTQKLGSKWYRNRSTGALIVPSSIIFKENNIILNTNGPNFDCVEIKDVEPFDYDKRLLK